MQEKAMVADALNSLNSSLKTYTDMISQTENQQLRSTLQQMRNEAEQSQYELYQIAKNKNYYKSAGQASQNEINDLKSTFAGSSGWSGSKGMAASMGGSNLHGTTGNSNVTSGGNSGVSGVSGNLGMTGSTGVSGGSFTGTGISGNTGMSGSTGMTGGTGMSGATSVGDSYGDNGMTDNNLGNVGGMNSY